MAKIGLDHPELSSDEIDYIFKNITVGKNITEIKAYEKPKDSNVLVKKIKRSTEINFGKVTKKDIYNHILNTLDIARQNGKTEIILISGDIHRAFGLNSKMPSVCSAMYQAMSLDDEILATTPSGKSSTIKIRYFL